MPNLKFEIKRKLFHLTAILYIPLFYIVSFYFNKTLAIFSLVIVLTIFVIIEILRLKFGKKLPLFHLLYRDKEQDKISGNIYFAIGAIIAFTFFTFPIAATVILMTTLGDMAAAIFGIRFGKHWLKHFPDRAWEGIVAEFIVDFIIAMLILKNPIIATAMAFVATLVETTCNKFMDDNLSIPIFAGLTGQILKTVLP